jgi:hypothetical protein
VPGEIVAACVHRRLVERRGDDPIDLAIAREPARFDDEPIGTVSRLRTEHTQFDIFQ